MYRRPVDWTTPHEWLGRRVLVTGASGFLGTAVSRLLLEAGAEVHGTGNRHLPPEEVVAWPLVLLVAVGVGALLSLLVGLVTLRLSGTYFVIFTFGLTELLRQLVNWYETTVTGSIGRYVFVDVTPVMIYFQLLGLFVAVLGLGWWLSRSRLGFALRLVGEDEAAARHCGIHTTRVKLLVFTLTLMGPMLTLL